MTIANMINDWMERRGVRAVEVARSSGVSEQQISRYRSGRKVPSGRTLARLMDTLMVPADEQVRALRVLMGAE